MTENIFENGGEFCMRGDKLRRPVEWCWLRNATDTHPVVYADHVGVIRTCKVTGQWSPGFGKPENDYDLIPIPSPPQIVPWESPDDVPDVIWFRCKSNGNLYGACDFVDGLVRIGRFCIGYQQLLDEFEYHTNRRANDGWQPCGKVVKS